jgi:hypothetical protein
LRVGWVICLDRNTGGNGSGGGSRDKFGSYFAGTGTTDIAIRPWPHRFTLPRKKSTSILSAEDQIEQFVKPFISASENLDLQQLGARETSVSPARDTPGNCVCLNNNHAWASFVPEYPWQEAVLSSIFLHMRNSNQLCYVGVVSFGKRESRKKLKAARFRAHPVSLFLARAFTILLIYWFFRSALSA